MENRLVGVVLPFRGKAFKHSFLNASSLAIAW